jgi:hypothetical protein
MATSAQETTAIEPKEKTSTKIVAARKTTKADTAIVPTYLGTRPIVASNVEVIDTLPDRSPIVKSSCLVKTVGIDNRPIVASRIPLQSNTGLPNNRPVVEQQLEDPLDLMGFLD